eukprot:4625480-Prymnesium_polylepis.1
MLCVRTPRPSRIGSGWGWGLHGMGFNGRRGLMNAYVNALCGVPHTPDGKGIIRKLPSLSYEYLVGEAVASQMIFLSSQHSAAAGAIECLE